MNRRRFVAALAATGASASLAGCSNPMSDDDDTVPERDPQNEVEDELYTAVGELNTAALSLSVVGEDVANPADVEFDESEPRDRVRAAREALDAAEQADSGELSAEIEQVRTYATVVDETIEAFASLLEGASELASLESEFDVEAVDEVRATIDASRDPLEAAVSASEAARSAAEDAGAEALSDLDAEFERVRDALDELSGFATSLDSLSLGYLDLLDGVDLIDTGRQQFENGQYAQAGESFDAAGTSLDDASEAFDVGSTPNERLDARFETAQCRTERLSQGAQHLKDAADSADSGNVLRARDQAEQGEQEIERVENC